MLYEAIYEKPGLNSPKIIMKISVLSNFEIWLISIEKNPNFEVINGSYVIMAATSNEVQTEQFRYTKLVNKNY